MWKKNKRNRSRDYQYREEGREGSNRGIYALRNRNYYVQVEEQ